MEQLQDPALAVLELVKNSWDADAQHVTVEIKQKNTTPTIVVSDNGFGMTRNDFRDHWLVIGASHKRGRSRKSSERPLIGEKGLGRLASYALGSRLTIESAAEADEGFLANLDWNKLLNSASLEDYEIEIRPKQREKGTKVTIGSLNSRWTEGNTEFLITHAQFLTSVPGQRFSISLIVDGKKRPLSNPLKVISRLAEAELEMEVNRSGVPKITYCSVLGVDETNLPFRDFTPSLVHKNLAGVKLSFKFYRRDSVGKKLSSVLNTNEIVDVLERYQGIRIYKDGINVPPYGLNGDDWAGLEKQRTSTGGPTMVPGNSQLIGELHIPKSSTQFVVTAGRSGFADQNSVRALAHYVRWAVKELGTARRANALGIKPGQGAVPSRVDVPKKTSADSERERTREALREIASAEVIVRTDPELREKVANARQVIEQTLDRNDQTLRLYAQLASIGIAATSFAHELRSDFDVVSEAVDELSNETDAPDEELIQLLNQSWGRIMNFAALFKVLPIKQRRKMRKLSRADVQLSVDAVSKLAPPDRFKVLSRIPEMNVAVVPAELDSILLNLVSNAVKAINASPRANEGRILVAFQTSSQDLDIRVADNGSGVSQAVANLMFEPLEGKFAEGTGMGLPIVKFISERYKGNVRLSTTPPRGYETEFRATLKGVAR
jgi:signal transduction histidine kinase